MKNPNGPSIEEMEAWADTLADQEAERLLAPVSVFGINVMKAQTKIDELIEEAKEIIQSEVNSTTPEYRALDRLCGAVELMQVEMTKTKAALQRAANTASCLANGTTRVARSD